jgi:hypothetical protein
MVDMTEPLPRAEVLDRLPVIALVGRPNTGNRPCSIG